jgi:hypothetical protein
MPTSKPEGFPPDMEGSKPIEEVIVDELLSADKGGWRAGRWVEVGGTQNFGM